jgi:hypothetical protein
MPVILLFLEGWARTEVAKQKRSFDMYQEAENGIFKPVLGALSIASVFLTIVGNLVFAPKPSLVGTVQLAEARQPTHSEPTRQVEPAPEAAKLPELATQAPRNLAVDVSVAGNEPLATPDYSSESETVVQPETAPKTGENLVALPLAGPVLPQATVVEVLVSESAPVAESVTLPEPAPNGKESIAVLPVQPVVAANETPIRDSAANVPAEPESTHLHDEGTQRPTAVAELDLPSPFVVEPRSHHDRRMLRKAEHQAKRQIRLAKHGRVVACR